MAAGLTSIRYALLDRWEHALIAIAVAAIFDTLDGRVARLLKGASKFGAELDSLSDFVCFGVAPGLILYLWVMQEAGPLGWTFVLLYTMSCGLRLARFNVALEDENAPAWKVHFFAGVPAPAAAGLVLFPLVLSFNIDTEYLRTTWLVGFSLITVGGMMVSSIPTFSFKKVKVTTGWVLPTMLIVAGIAAAVATVPWITIAAILGSYLVSIPISFFSHQKFAKSTEARLANNNNELKADGASPSEATTSEKDKSKNSTNSIH